MRRVLLVLICFSLYSLAAFRISDHPVSHVQPSGEKVTLLLNGDEYYHYLTDDHGYTVLIDPRSDAAVYADLRDGKLVTTELVVGIHDPSTSKLEVGIQPNQENIRRKVLENLGVNGTRDGSAPTTGTINNVVIFVRFLDQGEYTEPLSIYDTAHNSTTAASMRGFFLQESSNQLTVNSTFYPAPVGGIVRSFQDGHARGYFSPLSASNPIGYNGISEGKHRLWQMMMYAVNSVSSSIPSSIDIDTDNDGFVDNVTFICQGTFDSHADILWPHQSYLFPYTLVQIGSLWVKDYNLQLSENSHPGALSHEFSHSMNFPDLYHYDNNLEPVGAWDTMAATSNPPQHHTTYLKHKYGGWFSSIPLISPTATATQYSLTAIDQNPFSCYKIASTRPNEYYMLEYRRDTGTFESGVPASGLIVYRILSSLGGSSLWGNPHGPPDEVYVYRPGIDINNGNGYINDAVFSNQSGRVDIYNGTDPSPWLYGDGSVQLPGNLVITDVGSSGGNSISFWIKNTSPNRWLGTTGAEWTEPLNWSHGTVPTVDDDVVIVHGSWDPMISEPGQACKSLEIRSGGVLSIQNGSLEVADNVVSYGRISLSASESSLYVYDDLSLLSGSETTLSNSGAEILVEEDILIASGAVMNWSQGYLELSGTSASVITCQAETSIGSLRVEKSSGASVTISGASTAGLTINGSIYVQSGTFYNQYNGTTILKGGLYAYNGSVAWSNGTLSIEGNSSATLRFDNPGSYLHNLRIAKSGTAGLNLSTSNTFVGNDLSIVSGFFSCGSYSLHVGGNWINTAGPDSFYEGSGRIVLNGISNQSMSTETFNILELNINGRMLIPSGVTVSCAVYDWTAGGMSVSGGAFFASDLADDGIFGSYTLNTGSIELTQDASHYIDLRSTNIIISGGLFRINGGSGPLWLAYQGTTTFTMSSGYFDVRDQDIMISNAYTLNETITGGYIRTTGDFTCQRTDFNPTGGIVELWGGANSTVFVASGSNLSTLLINKSSTREDPQNKSARYGTRIPLTRANTVSTTGTLNISDSIIIFNGIFDVSGQMITINNDLQVLSMLKMSSGTVQVADNVIWNGSAQVSGGTVNCGGNWTFGPASSAVLSGSTVVLNNPYGANLANNSSLSSFGSLQINATEEYPICAYSSTVGASLKVTETLSLIGSVTLNLFEGICMTHSLSILEGCTMIVGDGGSLDVQSSLILAGSLDVGPGSVYTHGLITFPASGLLSIDWGSFINDSPWFDMRGTVYLRGGMDINNGSFEIMNNNVYLASHPTRLFSNAMLSFGRSFSAIEPGAYEPVWGSLIMTGDQSAMLTVSSPNFLPAVEIQKTGSAVITLASETTLQGLLNVISGTIDLNGNVLNVLADVMVQGLLLLSPASQLRIEGGRTLSLYYGGQLHALGTNTSPVGISSYNDMGYYAFNVPDGCLLKASNCVFEHMGSDGIYLHEGATVDQSAAFECCVFQNGAPGGWLLRMDSSQSLSVNGAIFPTNTWSGAGNVIKTVNAGNITFVAYTGAFSGSSYETDPHNRISWQPGGIMPVHNLRISICNGCYTLVWDYPYSFSYFKVYGSNSPTGPFSLIGTSSGYNWTSAVNQAYHFYRVTAVQNMD